MTPPSPAAGPDPITEWRAAHERVCTLVEEVGDEAVAAARVPACPGWTARELLAHVVGLGADVLAGNEPDDHGPDWTAAQVDARADRSASELVAEWRGLADDLEAWMADHGSRPLNDVVIHEQDLRGALGRPGGRESAGVAIVRDRMAARVAAALEDTGSLRLEGETWSLAAQGHDGPGLHLRADDFDLFRALTARRTEEQLRGYVVTGELTPWLPAFSGLGALPTDPLEE